MKLFICSDIHGDLDAMQNILDFASAEKCDKILILGDLLYHGPRNDLPAAYNPKAVIDLLNQNKKMILSVRGNCDTEVDQMVLEFPILADYALLNIDGVNIFATHGHNHNLEKLPMLGEGDILLHGHTHIQTITPFGNGNYYINPGSVSIPKGGNPKTYAIYENHVFEIKSFKDGETINKLEL